MNKKCKCKCHTNKKLANIIHKNIVCDCKKVKLKAKEVKKWLKENPRKNGVFKIY